MSKFKLTNAGRALVAIIIIAIIGGIVAFAVKSGLINFENSDKQKPENNEATNIVATSNTTVDDDTIHLSLDEWAGWISIITANGGLTTQPGSTFDDLGINVEISVINDATESSNALIAGDLQAAGYTTNRVAFLSNKFKSANFDVVMPVFTNYSFGGDGIIASKNFADINTWVNARIGVPVFSEAQTLVAWFVKNSDLSEEDQNKILDNLITFTTANDAGQAFFAGELDVAATWEPYLTQARTYTNSTVVFDTRSSSSLVMDGILFDRDWAENHRDVVEKFIQGVIASYDQPIDYDAARDVFPMYENSLDSEIDETYANAKMCSWKDNKEILTDTAPMIYSQMCDIWEEFGETVDRDMANELFDVSYIENIKDVFVNSSAASETTSIDVTDEYKESVTQMVSSNTDYDSLLSKTANVSFVPDTAVFVDQATAASELNQFVDIAKTLNGTLIVINGNIFTENPTEFGKNLSVSRAQAVANYLMSQGIDAGRMIITGKGNEKYMTDKTNGTVNNDKSVYQSTDIAFLRIEG